MNDPIPGSILKHIQRQYNRKKLPHPLLDGLVFVAFGPVKDPVECLRTLQEKLLENRLAEIIDSN